MDDEEFPCLLCCVVGGAVVSAPDNAMITPDALPLAIVTEYEAGSLLASFQYPAQRQSRVEPPKPVNTVHPAGAVIELPRVQITMTRTSLFCTPAGTVIVILVPPPALFDPCAALKAIAILF